MGHIYTKTKTHKPSMGQSPSGTNTHTIKLKPGKGFYKAAISAVSGGPLCTAKIISQPSKGHAGTVKVKVAWFAGVNPMSAKVKYTVKAWDYTPPPKVVVTSSGSAKTMEKYFAAKKTFKIVFEGPDAQKLMAAPIFQVLKNEVLSLGTEWVVLILGLATIGLGAATLAAVLTMVIYMAHEGYKLDLVKVNLGGVNPMTGQMTEPSFEIEATPT